MIFQEPMSSLSPVHTIGDQIDEIIVLHEGLSAKEARVRTVGLLDQVGVPGAKERAEAYPFELSGGLRQRAMIAMALACTPKLLIADEPTTALDVTTQAQILDLLRQLQEDTGMAMLFITHDLGVVAEIADDIAVMYLGDVVEQGDVFEVFRAPSSLYAGTDALGAAAEAQGRARAPEPDQGHGAFAQGPAGRLRLHQPLPPCLRALRGDAAERTFLSAGMSPGATC